MRFRIGTAVLSLLVAASLIFGVGSEAKAAESVKFLLDWLYGGKHAPFFVARDKGFFKKNGLDVTILKGHGSGKAATFVDTGQVDYSYGDFLTAVKLMSKGAKNRAVGVGMAFNGGAFAFLEGSGIKTPKDLEGKRFGTTARGFGIILMPALAAASGFDDKKVIVKIMKGSVRTPAMFEDKIDFMSATNGSSIQRLAILAKRNGKKAKYLFFKNMGLETYGHVLQTQAERIKKNPDQVRRFVTAVFDASAWAIKNPEEALEIYMKANPHKDREISREQMRASLTDVQDPETAKLGLGYMKESMVKKSVAIANKYFKLSPQVDHKMTYTNQFIRKNPAM